MWIMECKEHAQEFKMYNNNDRTKLRPLMPRPIDHCATKSISMSESSVLPLPHYWCLQNPSFPPWNQFPSPGNCVNDYGIKREMSAAPLVTSRWNPTPEQLQALEEMYRRGIRTPSAEQIQQIASKLRRFGKIEGKNVFYWFQNHKARERQRKRRQELESLAGKKMRHGQINLTTDQRPLGLSNRRRLEIEQAKKLPMPSNITALQYSINEELDNEELQQQSIAAAGESTETSCWQLDLSCCLSPNNSEDNVAAKITPGQENSKPFAAFNLGKLLPAISTSDHFGNGDSGGIQGNFHHHHQTLELFPMKGGNGLESHTSSGDEETNDVSSIVGMSKLGPNQYYEFLPIKDCY